ncbi:probable RNA helicase armi [Copidosoma floridanum]|uniref:probable RNA helicase armi n=1 Tax=Copidosoma floridanum TaxID=29053 RepID=UPI0006C9507B|nr:probable RNA helicase armi [Copidosoma floridanum]
MFSFLGHAAKKAYHVYSGHDDLPNDTQSGGHAVEADKSSPSPAAVDGKPLDSITPDGVPQETGAQVDLVEEDDEGCIYAYGTVSLVHNSYVLIENRLMCEMQHVVPADLRKGDRVKYMAYRASKGEDLKVRKIISKSGPDWEKELGVQDGETERDLTDDKDDDGEPLTSYPPRDEDEADVGAPAPRPEPRVPRKLVSAQMGRQLCMRVHVGRVNQKKGRKMYLEDGTLVNLDNVAAEFVPVVGDWLQLDCLFKIDGDVMNFKGEIVEIKTVKPLRRYNKMGRITDFNEELQYGVVDRSIVFNKFVCRNGYLPCIGDKVIVESIESDQEGLQTRWRALSVVPIEDVTNKYDTSAIKKEPQLPYNQMKDLMEDKEDIEITKDIVINLDIGTTTSFEVNVKNNGVCKQVIMKCAFLSRRSDSQLILITPERDEKVILNPEREVTYVIRCKGMKVGVSKELIIFKFRNFKIGRICEINVKSKKTFNVPPSANLFNSQMGGRQSVIPQVYEDGRYIRGVKPYKPAKFIPVRPVTWKIPPVLWSTIDSMIQNTKTQVESELALQEKIPCLNRPLSFNNYKQRFNYLLYLEEIAMVLDMKRFSMESAVLHRNGEYMTLNVPGLAEKRPSLIIGDRVIIHYKWETESKCYEGFIHKIKCSDVYLKFNAVFHEIYDGEECTVGFRASTTVLQRCHAAIGTVIKNLGPDFLFPQKVEQKEPQYNFVDVSDGEAKELELPNLFNSEDRIKLIESILYKRELKWFNKKLNPYQKEAVKNILRGLARPLPYVIFGPPGTGKTITVVEAILQIYYTITESRILIATPSNSSANLITERLLDARVLQPGDLVRLVAYHYLDSDMIPELLLPFCVTADIAEEGTRTDINRADPRGCQTQVTLKTLCRHRIIIGTCSALGILYNMGCKPGHFTHLFVDEAGQASEPEIMIPLTLAHKDVTQVILAGDPKQLGPITQSRLAGYFGLNDSFLVRLLQQFPYQKDLEGFETGYDPRLITKLLMNYRSLPDLLDLPNKLFYDAELIPQVDPEYSKEAQLLEKFADMLPKRLGAPSPVTFHCVNGTNMRDPDSPSWYNPEEATQIYTYLVKLLRFGLKSDDIGIITPYAKQVFTIRNLLANLDIDLPKVGSVEEFQGQERKVILLSTVRTSEDKVKNDIRHSLGFVAAPQRLNVAITRARALLIIVGHPKLLQQDVYWRSVLEHCSARSAIIGLKLE